MFGKIVSSNKQPEILDLKNEKINHIGESKMTSCSFLPKDFDQIKTKEIEVI
jgi:hypothetical protein